MSKRKEAPKGCKQHQALGASYFIPFIFWLALQAHTAGQLHPAS
jgi:hypothetical protein